MSRKQRIEIAPASNEREIWIDPESHPKIDEATAVDRYVYPGPHAVVTIRGITFERGKPIELTLEVARPLVERKKIKRV